MSTPTKQEDPNALPDLATSQSHDLRRSAKRFGDSLFRGLSTSSGLLILVILAAVAVFLVALSLRAMLADPAELPITHESGVPLRSFWEYAAPFAFGTVWSSALAMLFAVPVAVGIALFLTHYAPKRVAQIFGYIIDLLAAVPSVVFGLWGITVLAPMTRPAFMWLNDNLGDKPVLRHVFGGDLSGTGRTILTAALVLAVMVLPIITAISREVFTQTPRLHEEASLALGATRWEMIRQAVLPFGKPGIISACMLGLGRALGETMAVAMVLSPSTIISFQLLTSSNPSTIAANIALNFPEAVNEMASSQLIATGLVLFVITLAVNMTARWIINRRKEFSGAN